MSEGFRAAFCLLLLTALVTIVAASANTTDAVQDDLTTEYAKRIILQSKAAEMRGMLNTKVAPCDDFYNYACGNWHRQNPAQLFRNIMTGTFQLIAEGFDRRLKKLLQSGKMHSELEEKAQIFYQSCEQVNREDLHYKMALQNVFREFGGFPVLEGESWKPEEFNWWKTVAKIQNKYSKSIIFDVSVMQDVHNKTLNRVYLLPAENNKLRNSDIFNLLEEVQAADELETYFGLSAQLAKQTSKQLNNLERLLWAGLNSNSTALDDNLLLYEVAELQKMYGSHLNLTEFLELSLGANNVPQFIYVYGHKYLNSTLNILKQTPPTIQANYILFQLIQEYFIDAPTGQLAKWCTTKSRKYFVKLVDHMIYARYRSAETESEVHKVWSEIRQVFRQQLSGDKLDWMSNKTRQLAIQKLDAMQLHINNYDNINFNELYGNLTIQKLNYVANVQQLQMARAARNLESLKMPPALPDSSEITSNTPAYSLLENHITIPVALLQPHYLWDSKYPQALKYATLGYLLAHEMLHGFDIDDAESWWDERSSYEFSEKRKCFEAQYHSYKYEGTHLRQSAEQSENIADNGGIKLAYIAYQHWLEQQSTDVVQRETLSGLPLTSRQLFFVAFAQLWCDDVQSLFKLSLAKNDDHAPARYRVIGSLSNFQEFSWVYNCPQQAKMDPEYKCAIY